jgi:hypothetical protein
MRQQTPEVAMQVRIYRPAQTAMQQGRAGSNHWVLEFEPTSARRVEPLMGWTSSSDMRSQVRLKFATKDEAVAYAKKQGYMYRIDEPRERPPPRKAYADNFRYTRVGPWTH